MKTRPQAVDPQQMERLRTQAKDQPESARAHLDVGTAALKLGRQKEAEEALRRAVELDAQLVEGWVNLAGALFMRWDFEGCVQANGKAIECKPELVKPHYNQGLGYLYWGKADKMLDCFRKVVQLDPSNGGGHYYLAVALHGLGRDDEARESLDRAMELGYKAEPELLKALGTSREAGGAVPTMEVGPGCKTDS